MNGSRRAWWLIGLLSATAAASYLARVNVSVAGVQMMQEFHLSQVAMGRIFSAFILGYALFQIPSGLLADRIGAPRLLAAAGLSWVVAVTALAMIGWGPLAFGAGSAMAAILGIRFLLGMCEAPTFPAAGKAVSRWIPVPWQGRANGLVIAAIGFGSAVAPPLLTAVMVNWGWRAALMASAVPALLVGLGWCAVREPRENELPAKQAHDDTGGNLGSLSFVLLTLSYTLQGYVSYIFVFWFYLYLVDVRHFDLMRSALLGSMPWIFSIVSIPLGGLISDRLVVSRVGLVWGRRLVPMAGFMGAGIFLAVGAHTGNAYVAAVCLALATALVLCVEAAFWATAIGIAGNRSGVAGGVLNMGGNLGGLISPILTPVLAEHMGWENALYVGAGVSLAAGIIWFRITAQAPPPPVLAEAAEAHVIDRGPAANQLAERG